MPRDADAYTAELMRTARIVPHDRQWLGTLPALSQLRIISPSPDACRVRLARAVRQELEARQRLGRQWPLLGVVQSSEEGTVKREQ